jgi:hypothetical protein
MTDANDSKDLVIIALRQRIGELVPNYEYAVATLRADITKLDAINKDLVKRLTPQPETPKEFPSVSELLEEKNV